MHYGAMKNYYMNVMGMSDQAAWKEANKIYSVPMAAWATMYTQSHRANT